MVEKTRIISELGDAQLLLPRMISEALVANDRVKYFFALVQVSKAQADNPLPVSDITNLQSERLSSGVSDATFDRVAASATRLSDGRYQFLYAGRIFEEILCCVEEMMKPFQSAGAAYLDSYQRYHARLDAIKQSIGGIPEDETMSQSLIDEMTSAEPKEGDSLHRLVMDLHRDLNSLQSSIYRESIEGASVYGLNERDRTLVSCFMKGVNQTSKLKFDHPGLGTIATRSEDELMIQNDIGETDAHVIVIKVKDCTVSITCTDVHRPRLVFFHSILDKFDVKWSDTATKRAKDLEGSGEYYLSTGVYQAKEARDLEIFLTFLCSRLIFLIDWNKARKQLRLFLSKGDTLEVLKWAANTDHGHMAYLRMGADRLVLEAIEQLANAPLRFGDDFGEVLGKKKACEFLKFVLATCSEGLLQAKSEALIRDEVRAELAEYFHSVNEDLLAIASDHASLVVEIATAVRDGSVRIESDDVEFLRRNVERGRKWESEADTLLNKVRLETKRSKASPAFELMLSRSDDAADSLEDSLFLLALASKDRLKGSFHEPLLDLAEIAARASMEHLKAIEDAKTIHKWSPRGEMGDFLEAIDKVLALEHDADDAQRKVKEAVMINANDYKQLQLVIEISKDIEQATDALMKSAIALKDYVLEELAGERE